MVRFITTGGSAIDIPAKLICPHAFCVSEFVEGLNHTTDDVDTLEMTLDDDDAGVRYSMETLEHLHQWLILFDGESVEKQRNPYARDTTDENKAMKDFFDKQVLKLGNDEDVDQYGTRELSAKTGSVVMYPYPKSVDLKPLMDLSFLALRLVIEPLIHQCARKMVAVLNGKTNEECRFSIISSGWKDLTWHARRVQVEAEFVLIVTEKEEETKENQKN